MAAPLVVVQGLPPAPDLRNVALWACNDALKHRQCISAEEQDRSTPAPSVTAVIRWPDGTDRHVRVTLERSDATANRRVDRDTRFVDQDPIVERWRTIGLVIAALVGESEIPHDGALASGDRQRFDLTPAPDPYAWIGLSAVGGPGLDDGSMRLGGAVHGAAAVSSALFVQASASYALRPLDERRLDVRWSTVAVGAGAKASVPRVDLVLRARVEILVEYLHASTAAGAAVSGGGSKTSPGIRGGGDVLWPAKGAFGIALGFSVWSLPGGTSIQVDQRKLGSSQWLSYAALLGVEWSLR